MPDEKEAGRERGLCQVARKGRAALPLHQGFLRLLAESEIWVLPGAGLCFSGAIFVPCVPDPSSCHAGLSLLPGASLTENRVSRRAGVHLSHLCGTAQQGGNDKETISPLPVPTGRLKQQCACMQGHTHTITSESARRALWRRQGLSWVLKVCSTPVQDACAMLGGK